MKPKKMKKIATKVTVKIALGLLAVFILLAVIIESCIKYDLVEREQDKLTLLATQNASIAREFMEAMLDKQTVLINTISNMNEMEDLEKTKMLKSIIADTKKEETDALSLFYIAEPDTFLAETPDGFAIFATEKGVMAEADMYQYINKELYEGVKKSKQMTVIDPFQKTIDGREYTVITVVRPILNKEGVFAGVVGSNIDVTLLNNADYNSGGFTTFMNQIICGHQSVITNSKNPEVIGKQFEEVSESKNTQKILDTAKAAEPLMFVDKNTDGKKYYKSYVPFYIKESSVVWLSGTSITKAEFDAQIIKQIAFIVLWLAAGLLVLAGISRYTIKKSLLPIQKLQRAVKELSQGNLHYELDYTSNDEFGALADSLRESSATLFNYVTDIDRAMSEMANGNFDLGASQPFVGDFMHIEESIDKFLHTMSTTLGQIKIAAEQVSYGSLHIADGAQSLAQSAVEQASSVVVLSTEMAGVSEKVKSNAGNAARANQLAGTVGGKIHMSSKQMVHMITAMSDIDRSSREIRNIIKIIEDISFQTNILALNVAVEAARAGEAGKGFAVVSNEVRKLATKSSEAVKQMDILITNSVDTVQNGVEIAHKTAESLSEVVTGAEEITMLIEEISNASAKQTVSIAQSTIGLDQISAVVQTNSAGSEEFTAASEELSGQADQMKLLVSQFRIKAIQKE